MRPATTAMAFLITVLGHGNNLNAQADSTNRTWCWTAQPAPRCRLFPLTSFGVFAQVEPSSGGKPFGLALDWGAMINFTRREAIGATYYLSVGMGNVWEGGPGLRYRAWINPRSSLDVAAGLSSVLPIGYGQAGQSAAFVSATYSPSPSLGIVARHSWRGTDLGLELGSGGGITVAAVVVLVGAVAAAALSHGF